jgi:hypothetical protein
MRYDAAAFLESLFCEPIGSTVGTDRTAPRPAPNPADLPADWHFLWVERAAIMEFDGDLPRDHLPNVFACRP